jgi:hypothetical protein
MNILVDVKLKLETMKQEDRELLFIDLCGRVPYEVIVCIDGTTNVKLASVSYWEEVEVQDGSRYLYDISDIKPYLFPMYTMTEEQYKTYCELEHSGNMEHLSLPLLEWLNKNHFDYRGLIEKGLAIDASGLNIY